MRKLRKCLVQCLLAQADVFKQLVLFNQQTKKQKKSTIYYHKRQWKTENPHNGEAEMGMFGIFCIKIEIADDDNMKQGDERLSNLLLCSNTHLRMHLQQHCCSSYINPHWHRQCYCHWSTVQQKKHIWSFWVVWWLSYLALSPGVSTKPKPDMVSWGHMRSPSGEMEPFRKTTWRAANRNKRAMTSSSVPQPSVNDSCKQSRYSSNPGTVAGIYCAVSLSVKRHTCSGYTVCMRAETERDWRYCVCPCPVSSLLITATQQVQRTAFSHVCVTRDIRGVKMYV